MKNSLMMSLKEEVKALPHLTVFMVPGKLVRAVPILLTETMKACIDLFISCRCTLIIPATNNLLFGRIYTDNPFDGTKILRELRKLCTLKNAEFLTATGLRHHIATKSQVYGDDTFTDKIYQHLGHTKTIHKQNYRFPIQAMQKGQVGHRLLKMDGTWDEICSSKCQLTGEKNENFSDNIVTDRNQEVVKPENSMTTSKTGISFYSDSSVSDDSEVYSQPKKRRRWTQDEKSVVLKNFSVYIKNKKILAK